MFPGLLDGENNIGQLLEKSKYRKYSTSDQTTEKFTNIHNDIAHQLVIRVCQSQVEYFSDLTGRLCCKLY